MKKVSILRMLCGAAPLLLGIAPAAAQVTVQGDVRVSDYVVSRAEEKLFVSMKLDLRELDLKSNREFLQTQ